MLELRPSCENCNKLLPPESNNARICSYECTFCGDCVDHILKGVCPNCGGNFVMRPIRPAKCLTIDPASKNVIYNPLKS